MSKEGFIGTSKVKDLTPEAIKLGFNFAAVIKRIDSTAALEILEEIERPYIWRNQET